ncbi:hypothetical protein TPHA_0M01600 [Tetrapisispora phaffii CBS 4417]|uniref:Uncharacterized protein n=1 Tax=Tetrapisispora phaffii (strain ATCC 24235 / CBS 4417 / NBRC 1672 / NRRL Y-8282 / UCD 70-5) TaxID=1071381 RepID=G8C0M0_TETPH|nr:hypothetical protein TPHA_0M01600 [Tetrapisispora phaffii CBS 4417]CCE65735.1 hypothetical protein TPHA_0M01600 [Tetrapisispora phaffii CBS 4417]
MASEDVYLSKLNEIIELFQNYKPGRINLDNITKLCQTLGLESFIDDIDTNISRLSTASKIIVVDIDFDKSLGKVKDVKLVLASNFDNFNYFTDKSLLLNSVNGTNNTNLKEEQTENNILLNSLTNYADLNEFYQNLKYIYLLDTYSCIDLDSNQAKSKSSGNTTVINSGDIISTTNYAVSATDNVSSLQISSTGNMKPNSSPNANANLDVNNAHTATSPVPAQNIDKNDCKLDLFKYYTELADYVRNYFISNNSDFTVITNLRDIFGIYIIWNDDFKNPIARIYLEKSKESKNRLFEFVYLPGDDKWSNEDFEKYTIGVSLVMEIMGETENQTGKHNSIWFPKESISDDLILQSSFTDIIKENIDSNDNNMLNILFKNIQSDNNLSINDYLIFSGKCRLVNDFTTSLINISKFDIGNDHLDLMLEILNWIKWSKMVLTPVFEIISRDNNGSTDDFSSYEKANDSNIDENINLQKLKMKTIRSTRRRSSSLAKRPSIVEASILKDEGLQQFNLHEIMSQPVIEDEKIDGLDYVEESASENPLHNDSNENANEDIEMEDAQGMDFNTEPMLKIENNNKKIIKS